MIISLTKYYVQLGKEPIDKPIYPLTFEKIYKGNKKR